MIGLSLIAKDEEENLPRLLASVSGAFDSVVLADTGSTDRTVQVFEEWASGEDLPLGWRAEPFEWRDDFAAARNFADSLQPKGVTWLANADADEEIRDARNLRRLAELAPPSVAAISFWVASRDGGEKVRLFRRGSCAWWGRVHEIPTLVRPDLGVATVPPSEGATWIHHRRDWTDSDARDRRILAKWLADEPDNPRALALGAADALRLGDEDRAAGLFRRYVEHPLASKVLGPQRLDASRRALARLEAGGAAIEPNIGPAICFGGAA